ncbi:hypothetical protein BIW11_04501 [Tropilaelaps mercedesae]|uniref:Uncharacterized protein n=1 Tax=Tropilaelaps mercedesae TaxID=418985 RepID=A0A1V9X5J9_9ACAR|nr:hypothetical protein BIW11_04501 [Tropilaelaps mercedesae]
MSSSTESLVRMLTAEEYTVYGFRGVVPKPGNEKLILQNDIKAAIRVAMYPAIRENDHLKNELRDDILTLPYYVTGSPAPSHVVCWKDEKPFLFDRNRMNLLQSITSRTPCTSTIRSQRIKESIGAQRNR